MADRNVAADDTFAEFRKTMQETMTDVGDISQLVIPLVGLLLIWSKPAIKRHQSLLQFLCRWL